jgi:predicted kinase/RimJ/RimL family protein N-acetyltransferase
MPDAARGDGRAGSPPGERLLGDDGPVSSTDGVDDAQPFVVLGDGVVTLRCLRASDAAAVLAGEDDDQVRWLTEGHRSEPARLAAWISENRDEWRTGGPRRHLGVVDAASGELAGTVEAHLALPGLAPGTVNLSYAVFPRWRGRGFAARAVRLVCAWLAGTGTGTEVGWAAPRTALLRVDAGNVPSLRVARDAGFVRDDEPVVAEPGTTGPRDAGSAQEAVADGQVHHVRSLREPASVVLVCGPAGSGKSTHARTLERAGYVRLSFDEEAWRRGHRVHPLPDDVAAEVHADLRARLLELVGQRRDVVVDSSFWSRATRDSYRALVAPLGVTPVTHHLATPRKTVLRRLAARTGSGPHDVVVPPDLARRYLDGFETPAPDEGPVVVVEPR